MTFLLFVYETVVNVPSKNMLKNFEKKTWIWVLLIGYYGSGSKDPYHCRAGPDPSLFFSGSQDDNKNKVFISVFVLITEYRYI